MLEKDSKVKIQFKLFTFFVYVSGSPAAELSLRELSPLFVAIGKIRKVNIQHYCNRNNCSKSKGVAHIADIAHIAVLRFQVELMELFVKLLLVGLLVKLLLGWEGGS